MTRPVQAVAQPAAWTTGLAQGNIGRTYLGRIIGLDNGVGVLDLLVLKKDADGSLEAFEFSDLDVGEIGELRTYESELAMLLSEEDMTSLAAAIEPGSSAAVLVWENTWAAPFASAEGRSGGQLVASGRIPIQALLAAIEADEQ